MCLGMEGQIRKGRCLRKGRRRDCPHLSSGPAVSVRGEAMTEVTGNSFGEEEAQKGADMGLRPGRQQTLRRPQTHSWSLRGHQGPSSLQPSL